MGDSGTVAQKIRNLLAKQEIQVRSLGQEDHLKKGMATHSSVLAWRITWTKEPGGLQSIGAQKSDTAEQLKHMRDLWPESLIILSCDVKSSI